MTPKSLRLLLLLSACSPSLAQAQEADERQVETIIVTAPGADFDQDDASTLDSADVTRAGQADLLAALVRENAGITLQDAQNNPWQPNLVYRGFVASPLQGQAQGLAVYLDGARFNQPFGDTVGFDLIPDAAVRSLSIVDSGPVFGLNALGGSLILETATGRSAPGSEVAISAGSFGEREVAANVGGASGAFSYFGSLQYRREDGWRDFSPSELLNGYLDMGLDGESAGLHFKAIGADTDLTGNGVSPVELLAARRSAVFSWPDNSRSDYGRLSLHPWVQVGPDTRFEASLYRQRLQVRSLNGDVADIEECDDAPGFLCLEAVGDDGDEDETLLTDATGMAIADSLGGEGYGVLNRGSAHTRSSGILAQLVDTRPMWGGVNQLTVGFSYDSSETDFATATELGALTEERSVEGLGTRIVQADGAIAPVGLVARTRYWGVFLAESLPLTDLLTAEIGLRFNRADVDLEDQLGTALNGEHEFERFNPGVEFDWQIFDRTKVRAGYSETNRVPTPAELSCADEDAPCSLTNFFVADPPLEQVVARSWTVGASGELAASGWAIEWALAAFRTTNNNDIQYVASDIRGRAYFRNIGQTRRQGLEASALAQTGGLRARLTYAFTDAVFLDPLTLSSPANPAAGDDGTITVMPGDRLPGIPRHSASLTVDYAGMIQGLAFNLGGDVQARSSQRLVGDEAGLTPAVPGHVVVNLRGNLELLPGLSLFGEVRNLFDRDYATFGTFAEIDEVELVEAPEASDPRAYGPGAPRRFSVGLRGQF